MKTLEDYNSELDKIGVACFSYVISPKWEPLGVRCTCGCEHGEIENNINATGFSNDARCTETGRMGRIVYRHKLKGTIDHIEWANA